MNHALRLGAHLIFAGYQVSPVEAEVRLHALFSDGAVLQRSSEARIWGTAEPGEQITVTFRERATKTTTDDLGDRHASWVAAGFGRNDHISLQGFTIAGADQKFVNAQAEIRRDSVVVWSPLVTKPVAVRYGWADYPVGNLFNRAGLPASPFRTDDWLPKTSSSSDRL